MLAGDHDCIASGPAGHELTGQHAAVLPKQVQTHGHVAAALNPSMDDLYMLSSMS